MEKETVDDWMHLVWNLGCNEKATKEKLGWNEKVTKEENKNYRCSDIYGKIQIETVYSITIWFIFMFLLRYKDEGNFFIQYTCYILLKWKWRRD